MPSAASQSADMIFGACRKHWLWPVGGGILAAGMWMSVWARVNNHISASVFALASAGMGAIYLALLAFRPSQASRSLWATIIVVAILMRLTWFFVPAYSGEDYCRYLWDGAVAASGVDPYRYSPQQVLDGQVDNRTIERLAQSGRSTLEGINHPELRTIYPPVAQGAFALAYWIAPFNLSSWRIVLLAFDVLAALAVLGLLWTARLPLSLVFLYLWNPLLVAEIYGGSHMDMLAAAWVTIFALTLATNRPMAATVALALAIGVKLWPVLLLPFLVRALWGKWRRLAAAAGILGALVVVMAIPFASAFGAESDSGLLRYARVWSGRSGAYLPFGELGWWLKGYLSLDVSGHYVGRALMMLVLLPAALWLGLRRPGDTRGLCRRMALVILLMLLLAPVLWPWYYVAVIPLAVVASPRLGLLLWTALLPLCYLQAAGLSAGQLTWLVHVPVWLALATDWAWPHVARRLDRGAAHA